MEGGVNEKRSGKRKSKRVTFCSQKKPRISNDEPEVDTNETEEAGHDAKDKDDVPALAQHDSSVVDLAFAMDCTSSMRPYIAMAQSRIRHIVEEIVSTEKSDLRLALVEYRDHPPQDRTFVTRVLDFTPSLRKMKAQLDQCSAKGGGDRPEAVADALLEVSRLHWRKEATKICIFITDAPPHGLGSQGDGFPNGCPNGHDPMEITRTISEEGITMYMVGCEPSINHYKDIFMSIAHRTGGQYVPLASAKLLSKVIVGGVQEEISLHQLIHTVQDQVQADVVAEGGWDSEDDSDEDDLPSRVMRAVNGRGSRSKQLQTNGARLSRPSEKAKAWSRMRNLADVRKDFQATMVDSGVGRGERSERGRGGYRGGRGGGFPAMRLKGSRCRRKGGVSGASSEQMAPKPPEDYKVVAKDGIDKYQAKRMLKKMLANNKR